MEKRKEINFKIIRVQSALIALHHVILCVLDFFKYW